MMGGALLGRTDEESHILSPVARLIKKLMFLNEFTFGAYGLIPNLWGGCSSMACLRSNAKRGPLLRWLWTSTWGAGTRAGCFR